MTQKAGKKLSFQFYYALEEVFFLLLQLFICFQRYDFTEEKRSIHFSTIFYVQELIMFSFSFLQVIENVEMAGDAGLPKVKEYPTGYILFCCGFFLIYLIEELVHSCLDKSVHEHHNESIKAHR